MLATAPTVRTVTIQSPTQTIAVEGRAAEIIEALALRADAINAHTCGVISIWYDQKKAHAPRIEVPL